MVPHLRTGDTVTLAARGSRCRFGDVVAFVSADGSIVVHRFVAERGRVALLLGDNKRRFDPRIASDQIIGRAEGQRKIVWHAGHVLVVSARVARNRVRALIGRLV